MFGEPLIPIQHLRSGVRSDGDGDPSRRSSPRPEAANTEPATLDRGAVQVLSPSRKKDARHWRIYRRRSRRFPASNCRPGSCRAGASAKGTYLARRARQYLLEIAMRAQGGMSCCHRRVARQTIGIDFCAILRGPGDLAVFWEAGSSRYRRRDKSLAMGKLTYQSAQPMDVSCRLSPAARSAIKVSRSLGRVGRDQVRGIGRCRPGFLCTPQFLQIF